MLRVRERERARVRARWAREWSWAGPMRKGETWDEGGLLLPRAEREGGTEGAYVAFFIFHFLFYFPDLLCICLNDF
jgi:hypothetical protein